MTLKKKALTILTLTLLITTTIAGLLLTRTATANPIGLANLPQQYYSIITINHDGSITPQTDLISQNKNTYTLTANITDHTIITIECNDIVFDGDRHATNGAICVGYGPPGASNVTIKNVEATYSEIKLVYCFDCQITDVKTNHYIELGMTDRTTISQCIGPIYLNWAAERTQVLRSNITILVVSNGSNCSNVFYKNNFLQNNSNPSLYDDCLWDNGSVGNYWVSYNGTDSNCDGIGDIPYMIDQNNVDSYPLIYPYDIENDKIIMQHQEPVGEPLFPTAYTTVIFAAVVCVVVVCLGLAVFFRKRRV